MKLWIKDGDVALHDLARHIQIVSQSGAMEPPEAPQRERRTLRVRVEFRRESYLENARLVEEVRTALQTPATVLRWVDDSGAGYLERWLTITGWQQPESENTWGTYTQSIVFECFYYVHNLKTNCLPMTLTAVPGGSAVDLGAVFKWQETLENDYFDEMRNARRRASGVITASGAILANTLQPLTDARAALIEIKQRVMSALQSQTAHRMQYGNFDRVVRIRRFVADVDQARHQIEWSLTAFFTRDPVEDDYAWMEYEISERETAQEGIVFLGLRGRIGASSRAKADTALNALVSGPTAIAPSHYVLLSRNVTERRIRAADEEFLELAFDLEWRDTTTMTCTLKRPGGPPRDLGIVERFSDRYSAQLFDEMHPHRRRAMGAVTAQGRILLPDTMSEGEKRAALAGIKAALDADLKLSRTMEFSYGGASGIFPPRIVRIVDLDAQINRLKNQIEWSLQATYTRFPNESDYAAVEYSISRRDNHDDGSRIIVLGGKIAAPTPEAAAERLARLRQSIIPAGYVQTSSENTEASVSVESDRRSGTDKGDGTTFVELTFNEEWRKAEGEVVRWTLKISDADAVKEGRIRTTYSGNVTARAATQEAALSAAEARARSLGEGKHPFMVSSQIASNTQSSHTGLVTVSVDFQWEYERQGAKTWMESSAERSYEAFGQDVETVQGVIFAPTLAAADAAYQTLKNLYSGMLLLNERKPTRSQQEIVGVASLLDRYAFSFSVALNKSASAISYTSRTLTDWQSLTRTTTISGRVYAGSRANAEDALNALYAALNPGTPTGTSERTEIVQNAPPAAGSAPVSALVALEFSDTFVSRLTDMSGILECEVTQQVRYSGKRLVERPIPGGRSLFQDTGIAPGQRTVSGRVRAATEIACLNWARKCHDLLIGNTGYEDPPTVATTYRFLPQTDGTPTGSGANVLVFETSFQFQEHLPEHPFA